MRWPKLSGPPVTLDHSLNIWGATVKDSSLKCGQEVAAQVTPFTVHLTKVKTEIIHVYRSALKKITSNTNWKLNMAIYNLSKSPMKESCWCSNLISSWIKVLQVAGQVQGKDALVQIFVLFLLTKPRKIFPLGLSWTDNFTYWKCFEQHIWQKMHFLFRRKHCFFKKLLISRHNRYKLFRDKELKVFSRQTVT